MKLENKSSRNYTAYEYVLKSGCQLEVPENVGKILLNQEGVSVVIDVKEVEKLKDELAFEKAKAEALALGLKIPPKIGLAKLQEKIAAAKANA